LPTQILRIMQTTEPLLDGRLQSVVADHCADSGRILTPSLQEDNLLSISLSLFTEILIFGKVTVACRMCSTLTNPGSAMTPAWLSNTAALPWIFKFWRPAAGAPNAFPGPSPYEAEYIRLDMNMLPAAGGSAPMRGKPHPAPAAMISCNKRHYLA